MLLVDDDPDLAETLREVFELQEYEVAVAETGGDALNLIAVRQFDLILLDWQLPDMEGVAVCRQYRDSGGTNTVIMLTGMRDSASREAGTAAGASVFLTKPFTVDQLLECLQHAHST